MCKSYMCFRVKYLFVGKVSQLSIFIRTCLLYDVEPSKLTIRMKCNIDQS